jgi:hypothetical protein
MPAIELSLLPSLLAACLVLAAGGFLAQREPFLGRYSVPAPIRFARSAGNAKIKPPMTQNKWWIRLP